MDLFDRELAPLGKVFHLKIVCAQGVEELNMRMGRAQGVQELNMNMQHAQGVQELNMNIPHAMVGCVCV